MTTGNLAIAIAIAIAIAVVAVARKPLGRLTTRLTGTNVFLQQGPDER